MPCDHGNEFKMKLAKIISKSVKRKSRWQLDMHNVPTNGSSRSHSLIFILKRMSFRKNKKRIRT